VRRNAEGASGRARAPTRAGYCISIALRCRRRAWRTSGWQPRVRGLLITREHRFGSFELVQEHYRLGTDDHESQHCFPLFLRNGDRKAGLRAGHNERAEPKCVAPREWIRTIDRTGNNRLLCLLSYRGKRAVTVRNYPKTRNQIADSELPRDKSAGTRPRRRAGAIERRDGEPLADRTQCALAGMPEEFTPAPRVPGGCVLDR
jgi:hypothetical protein